MTGEPTSTVPIAEASPPPSGTTTIEAEGIGRDYGDVVAIEGLSLHAVEGEILGVLGPNGAGKTTAIRVLTTILAPTRGSFAIAGVPHTRPGEIRRRIGVLPESTGYPARQSGREYLRYHARLFGHSRASASATAERLLDEFGILDRARDPIAGYSRGMRQRLGIARALVNDPQVVFLDEPTLGLDPYGQAEMIDVIRRLAGERGATVLLSTHLLAEVEEVCTRVLILNRGRLVAEGTVSDVVRMAGAPRSALVRVRAESEALAVAALEGVPGVRVVQRPGRARGQLRISLGDAHRADGALQALLSAGITILEFELEGAGLSDAFLAVTDWSSS